METIDQKEILDMWVIYDRPSDYPDKYVVRKWAIMSKAAPLASVGQSVHDTLDQAREAIPQGLFKLDRFIDDDLAIKEVWV